MTRISNSEQVLAVVRAQLQRMAKRGRADKTSRTTKTETQSMTGRQMIEALAEIEGLSQEDFARTLIRALLVEEFGEPVANSAQFQAVVERTASAVEEDVELRGELDKLRRPN